MANHARGFDGQTVKLAFVTSLVPVQKPDTGFEIANVAILDALRSLGHQVVVFGFARPDDEVRADRDLVLLGRMVIENHVANGALKAAWLAGALASGLPVTCAKLWLKDRASGRASGHGRGHGRVVEVIEAHGPFDAIVLNSVTMAGAFPDVSTLAPTLLVAHNIEHVSAAQNAARCTHPALRRLYAREALKLRAIEEHLVSSSRFIWCLAEEDRQMLGADALAKSAVLPLVSTSDGEKVAGDGPLLHDVGLIGTWTWEPNLLGLNWFLSEVVPHLPPDLRIAVAGRTPPGVMVPPNVRLLGRVPDAAHFLSGCAVVALTSRAGTGVQLKTIEALQLGLPAVATSLSMRGLGEGPPNLVVADDAAAFADRLVAHVAAVQAGDVRRVDGAVFMTAQRRALALAITTGLAAI